MASLPPVTATRTIGPVTIRCIVTPLRTRMKDGYLFVDYRKRRKWYIFGIRVPAVFIRYLVAPIMRHLP